MSVFENRFPKSLIEFQRRFAPRHVRGIIEGSARPRVKAQLTGQYRNAGLHRSLVERSRGSRVAAYGD